MTAESTELEKTSVIHMPNLWSVVNALAADEKYPVSNRDILMIPIEMQISEVEKLFLNFSLHS